MGFPRRDFVHVDDVVDCTMKAFFSDSATGKVYNVGRGEAVPISKVAETPGNVRVVPFRISRGKIEFDPLGDKISFILENSRIIQIPPYEIEKLRNKRKTALLKFLKADNIGILITAKPGQANLRLAQELKKDLENKGKKVFIFLSNNIDTI